MKYKIVRAATIDSLEEAVQNAKHIEEQLKMYLDTPDNPYSSVGRVAVNCVIGGIYKELIK